LLRHARDERGRFVYRTTREGRPIEGPTSIYADCFAVYGISEYCRAERDSRLLSHAVEIFHSIRARIEAPDFREVAPYTPRPGRRLHALPMILTEVANELAQTTGDGAIEAAAAEYASLVRDRFLCAQRRAVLELLRRDH